MIDVTLYPDNENTLLQMFIIRLPNGFYGVICVKNILILDFSVTFNTSTKSNALQFLTNNFASDYLLC